jgi:hypothetical protein
MAHWLYPSTDRAAHENPKDIIPYHVMFREQRQGYPSPKSRFRFSGSVSG